MLQNPKNLLILLFIALMLAFFCIIGGHCRAYTANQRKIDLHSGIIGIVEHL